MKYLRASKDHIFYILGFAAGFGVCFTIAKISGRREAWDAPEYFTVGIPVMCAVVFALSYLRPERVWRWPLSMAIGQSLAMAIHGGDLTLWPLSIIAMTICSIPQFLIGKLAAWVKIKIS